MSDSDQKYPPGSAFTARLHWRLGAEVDIRGTAVFLAEVIAIDHQDDRLLCQLKSLESLTTTHPPEMADQTLLAIIRGLPGKYVFLPSEAAEGQLMFLKTGTLTGQNNYFLDAASEKIARFMAR